MLSSVALLAQGIASLALGEPLLVSRAAFDCLVRDIDKFRSDKSDVRVVMTQCPIERVAGYGPLPKRMTDRREFVETRLVLDAKKIECIRRNRRNIANIALPIGENYRIDLKRCARPVS